MAILLVWLPGCGKKRIVNPDTTPPNQIADFTADQVTETTLALHWTAPGDDGNTGQAAAYQIKYSKAQITQQNFAALSDSAIAPTPLPVGSRQALLLRDLQAVTMYYAAIRARDESYNWSPIAVVGPVQTARDSIPPGAVSDLRVATLSNQSIKITWTAPGDDGMSGRASRYEIRSSSQHIDSTNFDSATEITQAMVPAIANSPQAFNIQGLTPRTGYYIALKSIDDAGNGSSLSNVLHAITDRNVQDWYVYQDGTGDAPTIQAAIDSARGGETVLVGPGTFFENLLIDGKGISIIGTAGAVATTIDGITKLAPVFQISNVPQDTVRIQGLQLQHGSGGQLTPGADEYPYGGGIFAQDANIVVERNIISDNGHIGTRQVLFGGGMYVERRNLPGTPACIVRHNVISKNSAQRNGGGIAIASGVSVTVYGNTLKLNEAITADGGGLWCVNYVGTLVIRDNDVLSNVASDKGGGLYVHSVFRSPLNITNNVIAHNQANGVDSPGVITPTIGAGFCISGGSGSITNNSVIANIANATVPEDFSKGGGIALDEVQGMSITHNIIAHTMRGAGVFVFESSEVQISTNILWDNVDGHIVGAFSSAGDPNSFSNPYLCDIAHDSFAVDSISPAIQANRVVTGADRGIGCSGSLAGR